VTRCTARPSSALFSTYGGTPLGWVLTNGTLPDVEFEWSPDIGSPQPDDDARVIAGNAEGLASLADHLLRLATDEAPPGTL
jgi:hypothetical protein